MQKISSRTLTVRAGVAVASLLLAGCGDEDEGGAAPPPQAVAAATARVVLVQESLDAWASAESLEVAQSAAETVSNLITGPGVGLYGDADGDGVVGGESVRGLLPGADGEDSLGLPLQGCAGQDLLGGPWTDPRLRWEDLATRVAAWTPANNPFPVTPNAPSAGLS